MRWDALGTVTLNAFISFIHIPTVLVFEYLTHICLQTFPSFVKLFFFYIFDFFICYKCIPLDQLFQRLKKEMDLRIWKKTWNATVANVNIRISHQRENFTVDINFSTWIIQTKSLNVIWCTIDQDATQIEVPFQIWSLIHLYSRSFHVFLTGSQQY